MLLHEGMPVTFTILKPDSSLTWSAPAEGTTSTTPSSGSAGSATVQVTHQFERFASDNKAATQTGQFHVVLSNGQGCTAPVFGRR